MNNDTDSTNQNAHNTQEVLREIEHAAQTVVVNGLQNGTLRNVSALLSDTMREGADAFERKMGRPMDYSEMRTAFG